MYTEDSCMEIFRVVLSNAGRGTEGIEEFQAKIYGSDYYATEDDSETYERSSGFGGNEIEPSADGQIIFIVKFEHSAKVPCEYSATDELDGNSLSVSQISNLYLH